MGSAYAGPFLVIFDPKVKTVIESICILSTSNPLLSESIRMRSESICPLSKSKFKLSESNPFLQRKLQATCGLTPKVCGASLKVCGFDGIETPYNEIIQNKRKTPYEAGTKQKTFGRKENEKEE